MFRKGNRKNKVSRQKSKRNNYALDYQTLEPRQLLAVDFGVNFTGSTLGSESTSVVPDAEGDTGPTHTIEVLNGRYNAYDRFTGNRVQTDTLDSFFLNAGGSIITPTENPRVVFDETSQRFFVAAVGSGVSNWIHVAFSNSADPRDGWQTLQFVADSTGVHFNSDLSLSVDADAVYFTTNNYSDFAPNDVSIYSIPKADMFLPDPTLTNMSRFEGLNPALYGTTIQVAQNSEASDGMAVAIGWLNSTTAVQTNITGAGAPAATLSLPTPINLDFGGPILPTYIPDIPHDDYTDDIGENYRGADNPFQDGPASWPFNFELSVRAGLNSSVVEVDGSVFGVHTVGLQELVNYSAINWFEIDIDTQAVREGLPVAPEPDGTLYQGLRASVLLNPFSVGLRGPASHLIRSNLVDGSVEEHQYFFNPAIAVNENGLIVVTYNAIDENNGITNIGVYASVGTIVNGINRHNVQFEDPILIQAGSELYDLNTGGADNWGNYGSVRVDSITDNGFFVVMPFANTTDRWSIQNSFIELVDMNPIVEASHGNNLTSIRRSATSPNLAEVVMDGNVTDTYPYSALGTIEVWGHDGIDEFLVDYTNGDPVPEGGFVFDGGAGPDAVRTNSPEGAEFIIDKYDDLDFATNVPAYLSSYWIRFADDAGVSDGLYNETSRMIDVENLFGGPANDTFIFRNDVIMIGSAHGEGGDDRFVFEDDPRFPVVSGVGDDINGGTGNDTINFELKQVPTVSTLIGYGVNDGYDGRVTPSFPGLLGPIGGDNPDDIFSEINRIEGSSQHIADTVSFLETVGGIYTVQDEESFYVDVDRNERLEFFQVNILNGSNFVDNYYIVRNTINPVQLWGLGDNDLYYVGSNAPNLDGTTENVMDLVYAVGGPGENELWISNIGGSGPVDALILNNRVSGLGEVVYSAVGGTFDLNVTATPFSDQIAVHSFLPANTLELYALSGDDVFSIQDLSRAVVDIFGGEGDDTYFIERITGVSFRNLTLHDSVDAERDRVLLAGTVLDETWNITRNTFIDLDLEFIGIELFGIDGRGGNDTFNILDYDADIFLDGNDGNDVFNISSDGPGLLGNLDGFEGANIEIEGGTGTNQINVSDFSGTNPLDVEVYSDRIAGMMDGMIYYQSTGGTFTTTSGAIGGITLRGSNTEDDTFTVRELLPIHTLLTEGLGGEDTFVVRSGVIGDVRTSGGLDADLHEVFFGIDPTRRVEVIDEPTPVENRVNFYSGAANDTVTIDANSVALGSESVLLSGGFTFMSVTTFGGQDRVTMLNAPALTNHIYTGDNDDHVVIRETVNATGLRVVLGEGNDIGDIKGTDEMTFTRVMGGGGDDLLKAGIAAEGTVVLNGEAASDRYVVDYVGNGSRTVDVRDSGLDGRDVTVIRATPITDHIEVRASQIVRLNEISSLDPETVIFDATNEMLVINTEEGSDLIEVFSSVADITRINAGADSDTTLVYSTTNMDQLTIDAGSGADETSIFTTSVGTNVIALGGTGDDDFIIGSDVNSDNGNLGQIRGRISLRAGTGFDSMYVNDRGSTAPYSYFVGPTGISAIAGPTGLDRDAFSGINFDAGMETLELDANDLRNFFSIRTSQHTQFHINGNSPDDGVNSDFILLLNKEDGRRFRDEGNNSGEWTFDDGTKDVSFEDVENFFDFI